VRKFHLPLNKKLIFLGSFKTGSTNISQVRAFRDIGWQVIEYDFMERLKILGSLESRDLEIVDLCNFEMPDLTFISKGAGISVSCIRSMNKISSTILWYMDPIDDNWDENLHQRMVNVDLVACALSQPYHEAKKLNPNSFFIHEGFDELVDFPVTQPKKWDVSFIGQPKGIRAVYQAALGFKVIQGAYGTDHAKVVAASKINLNFVVNNSGCSDRVYKVLAAGGFLLTEDWPGRSADFRDRQDLVVFHNLADLNQKIRWYLNAQEEREMIAGNGLTSVQRFSRQRFARRINKLYLSASEGA